MTTPSEEEARATFGVHLTRGELSDGVHAYDTRDEGAPGMIDAFDAQLRSHASGSGFAQREAMARKAWEFYTTRETAMTHDFRGGYHQGVIDGAASRVSSQGAEAAITKAYNAVTGQDDDKWNPDKTLDALRELWAAASRVSTPPSEEVHNRELVAVRAEALREARVAGLREAADIADRMYAGTDGSALEKAWIGGCMATAAAIRNRVQAIEGVAPVPAVPASPTEPEPLLDADGKPTGWSYRPAPVRPRPALSDPKEEQK